MKNRPGLKQYIFAALGVVILVLLDQYTKLLAIAHLKDQSAFVLDRKSTRLNSSHRT